MSEQRPSNQRFRAVPVRAYTAAWKWSIQKKVLGIFWMELYWTFDPKEAQECVNELARSPIVPKPEAIWPSN